MSTKPIFDAISKALFGATRRTVLWLLFGQPDESFYLRQIVRDAKLGQGAVQRELQRLSAAGIILRMRKGKEVYYQANTKCPVFTELKGLMIKTVGLVDALRPVLKPLSKRICVAFVYGSFAKNTVNARSDVDIMVIGEVTFAEICEALRPAQEKTGREINPTVYPVQEFKSKLASGHHFLTSIMGEDKVFIIGGESEFAGLAE